MPRRVALAALCLAFKAEGMATRVIDHKIDFLDAICDEVGVLELGPT